MKKLLKITQRLEYDPQNANYSTVDFCLSIRNISHNLNVMDSPHHPSEFSATRNVRRKRVTGSTVRNSFTQ